MARHRRHKRYGSAVEVSLGALPFMNDSVNVMDVLIGIGAALIGSALVKGIFKKGDTIKVVGSDKDKLVFMHGDAAVEEPQKKEKKSVAA